MKTYFLLLLALATISEAQTRRPELRPEQAALIDAIRDARIQRARTERTAAIQKAREAGRVQARATRVRDRAFMAVWTSLTPEARGITNYPAISAARQQSTMDTALAAPEGDFPAKPDAVKLADDLAAIQPVIPGFEESGDPVVLAASVELPDIEGFPETEVPDLFTINRRFNWKPPHGQWMNQMLKDIDAAKAAGDAETYESLTKRYAAWAEQYLREDR